MAGNPLNYTTINAAIATDAAYFKGQRYYFQRRFDVYNQLSNTTTQLQTVGITAGADQVNCLNFNGGLNRMWQWMSGATPSVADVAAEARSLSYLGYTYPNSKVAQSYMADANTVLDVKYWLDMRHDAWTTSLIAPGTLSTYVSSAVDQQAITAAVNDFGQLLVLMTNGTTSVVADNMVADMDAVLGVS